MTAAFGTPAPLPRQPGFRTRPSESMARETAEMEERLAQLKTDLAAESEIRESTGPKVGGARWRSARTDRGTVRAYAKDVKVRHQKQLQQRPPHGIFASGGVGVGGKVKPQAGAGARAAAALRDEQQRRHHEQLQAEQTDDPIDVRSSKSSRRAPVHPDFVRKEVSIWCVGDTLEWLESLGLGKHSGVFQQNEISGAILLEVGLDDLDYMDVRVLADRKRILKGIEELRRGSMRPNADVPPPPAPAPGLQKGSRSSSGITGGSIHAGRENTGMVSTQCEGDRRGDERQSPARRKKQHWSQVKPLSDNQTEENPDCVGASSSNLASGQYDEAAARLSFAAAVAEWRGERPSNGSVTSLPQSPAIDRAPSADIPGTETVIVARYAGVRRQGTVGALLGGGDVPERWTNPFSSPRGSEVAEAEVAPEEEFGNLAPKVVSPPTPSMAASDSAGQRVRQVENVPVLDEVAEHEAFRRAVADWNRGRNTTSNGTSGDSNDAGDSNRADGASSATQAEPRRTAELMAEQLREQMDAEHLLQAQELEEKKRSLLLGLDMGKQCKEEQGSGARRKIHRGEEEPTRDGVVGSSLEARGEFGACGGAAYERQQAWDEEKQAEGSDCHEGDDVSASSASSSSHCAPFVSSEVVEACLEEGGAPSIGGVVEIEFVKSVLGGDFSGENAVRYFVDEVDSDDDADS